MRIQTVHGLAFGPLRRGRLDLAPGLTVIGGRNEAGKSTWHAAIELGICGMRRARGRRTSEQELIRRHRPWAGDEWKVRLRILLDGGRELDVTQDLDDPTASSIVDAITGRAFDDVDLYYEGSLDASRLLGLNRDIFTTAISVRQAQILAVRHEADGLQEQLQRAAQANVGDATAVAAIERLADFRSERVGQRRKGATKPLQRADEELRAAKQDLEHARQQQVEYTILLGSLEQAKVIEAGATAEHDRARRALALRRRSDLAKRIAEVRPLAARFAGGPPAPTEPLIEEERSLLSLIAAWEQRPADEPPPRGPSVAELEREIDTLPPRPEGDIEVAPEVEAAQERHNRATLDLDRHGRDAPIAPSDETLFGGTTAAELRGLAETLGRRLPHLDPGVDQALEEVERKLAATRRGSRVCSFAAIVALLGAVTLVLIDRGGLAIVPLAASLTAAGLAWRRRRVTEAEIVRQATLAERRGSQRKLRADAEQARDEATQRLVSFDLPADRDAVLRAAAALDDVEARREHRIAWQRIELELQTTRRAAEAELRRALAERGTPDAVSAPRDRLAALFTAYVVRCRANREQHAAASRRDDLEARLVLRRHQEESAERASTTRAELVKRLMDAGQSLRGAEVDDESTALAAIRECARLLDRRRSELETAHREHNRLLGLLDGATLPRLEARLADLNRELELAQSADPPMTEPPQANENELARAVEQSQAQLDRARAAASQLEGKLEERIRAVPDVVAAEERHRAAQDLVSRLLSLDSILEKTIAFLEEAKDETQREIAPRLRDAIHPQLPLVTAGRYVDVRIDPADLEVKVLERDGDWRSAMGLSHGTAEQIYLLLRIALTRLLVSTAETAPLLLDDVTVQSDSERARAILEWLHRESAERQVILFSQQDEVLTWARSRLTAPRDRLIELPGPGRARAAGE